MKDMAAGPPAAANACRRAAVQAMIDDLPIQ